MGILVKLANHRFVKWLIRLSPKLYCKFHGHDLKVSIDKPKPDPTVHHILHCGRCKDTFSFHNFAYVGYAIHGVNPQYGRSVDAWLVDSGVEEAERVKLVANLQKFRNRATRPDIITKTKEKANVHRTAGKKEGQPGIF